MDTAPAQRQPRSHAASEHGLDAVVSMSQLAAQLGVGVQTLYDLRSQGRGPRGYRRTGATVIARGIGTDAAAAFLGHASTAITEGHYIEPERYVDHAPADHLERTLRPEQPDGSLLSGEASLGEEALLAAVDSEGEDGAMASG